MKYDTQLHMIGSARNKEVELEVKFYCPTIRP